MSDRVLELPAQLEWGVGLPAPSLPGDRPVVFLGMGGSAMAAAVARLAVQQPQAAMAVRRGYGLPEWAAPSGALIVAVSYSGNTEEVMAGVEEALAADLPLAAVASGGSLAALAHDSGFPLVEVPPGLQPRAGIGFQAAAVVRILEGAGIVEGGEAMLSEASIVLSDLLGEGSGPAVALGRDIGDAIGDRFAVIYGGLGAGSLAAYRWKTQINENAKAPAHASEVPEANHNELEAWHRPSPPGRSVSLVYLRDGRDHPRVARRLDLMEEMIGPEVVRAGSVRSSGESALARFFSLAVVGDVASVAMAEAAGVDPAPVEVLESFKLRLREDG